MTLSHSVHVTNKTLDFDFDFKRVKEGWTFFWKYFITLRLEKGTSFGTFLCTTSSKGRWHHMTIGAIHFLLTVNLQITFSCWIHPHHGWNYISILPWPMTLPVAVVNGKGCIIWLVLKKCWCRQGAWIRMDRDKDVSVFDVFFGKSNRQFVMWLRKMCVVLKQRNTC